MSAETAPKWAVRGQSGSKRAANKAALLVVLRDTDYGDLPKTEIAKRLGVSRWTLDRYYAELGNIADLEREVDR